MMSLVKNVMYESTFPLFKTGVCSVEYRVALQTSLVVKKHLRKEEREWKGNRKRKKEKEGRNSGTYVRIVYNVFS